MNPNWAEENLRTIRTLMERSAVYRRALAPIMFLCGSVGIIGGLAGWQFKLATNAAFVFLWVGVATVSFSGALLLVRRQALGDAEPFWSPPTRRVSQALLPAFCVGLALSLFVLVASGFSGPDEYDDIIQTILVVFWIWLYGFAVHAASFFMPRGMRFFGWVFVVVGTLLFICMGTVTDLLLEVPAHLLMGTIFGGLHLAYGIYLYFTEKKNPVA